MLDFGLHCMDCMQGMKEFPDKFFDLAIVDPVYGGVTQGGYMANKAAGGVAPHQDYRLALWGQEKTGPEYFRELFRVSKNQIIWGGNYFAAEIGVDSQGWIVWDKQHQADRTFADCELAWTSFDRAARIFRYMWDGMLQGNMKNKEKKIHPCLPAGELVYFNGEWKCIETVAIGDQNDFGTVAAITEHDADTLIEISTTEGQRTVATWNHPFLVMRAGVIYWLNADQITEGDEILCLKNTKRRRKAISGADATKTGGTEWSMTSFGKNTTGKSRAVCKSITETLTKPTTIFPISSLSRPLNTNGCTAVAFRETANGINPVRYAESINHVHQSIGISPVDGSAAGYAGHAIASGLSSNAVCVSQTVGSVRVIQRTTRVYNLTIDGVPAFETLVGISHNTQKPVALYNWILARYANEGDIILDTHVGSASSLIACHRAGFRYVGFEIDRGYYEAARGRLEAATAQISMFGL